MSAARPYIVTVTPTIMDGRVVRWFPTEAAALNLRPRVSASRNGVVVEAEAQSTSDVGDLVYLIQHACDVMNLIRKGDDVRGLATHTIPFARDALVPVASPESVEQP